MFIYVKKRNFQYFILYWLLINKEIETVVLDQQQNPTCKFSLLLIFIIKENRKNRKIFNVLTCNNMLISDCNGKVELTSSTHNYMKIIHADKLRDRDRTVKLIRARHPQTKYRLLFEIVTLTGDCAWTVHERRTGGRNKRMAEAGTVLPGWPIKRVKLLKE